MKPIVISLFTFVFFSLSAFSQTRKVAMLFIHEEELGQVTYEKEIQEYISEHVLKVPNTIILNIIHSINSEVKDGIENKSGDFADTSLTSTAKAKQINKLILISYDIPRSRKQLMASGITKIGYDFTVDYTVQVINTEYNYISGSAKFYGSASTPYLLKETEKFKEDAIKDALKKSKGNFLSTYANLDDYFKTVLN